MSAPRFKTYRSDAGLSLVELMVGLGISTVVIAAIMATISDLSQMDVNNRLFTLLNQTYFSGLQEVNNPALFVPHGSVNNLGISPALRECLAGVGTGCLAQEAAGAKLVPASVASDMNIDYGWQGFCPVPDAACPVHRTTTYQWVCPSDTYCSGLRLGVSASLTKAPGRAPAKTREGSIILPARHFVSKGEIRFTCGTKPTFGIDFANLTTSDCTPYQTGDACAAPAKTFGGTYPRNCFPDQTLGCSNGFTRIGLFNSGDSQMICGDTPTTNVEDGACGSSNGQTLTAAPTDLCGGGTSSAVAGSGPWTWSCVGINGGATVACSAQGGPPGPPNFRWVARSDRTWKKMSDGRDLQVNSAGQLCDGGHMDEWFTGKPYPASPYTNDPSNGGDCPDKTAYALPDLGPCSTVGQKCHWLQTRPGIDWPSVGGNFGMHTHAANCDWYECSDMSKCPDGTPRTADGLCPGFGGKWTYVKALGGSPGSYPVTHDYIWGSTCNPLGQKTANNMTTDGTYNLYECQ